MPCSMGASDCWCSEACATQRCSKEQHFRAHLPAGLNSLFAACLLHMPSLCCICSLLAEKGACFCWLGEASNATTSKAAMQAEQAEQCGM